MGTNVKVWANARIAKILDDQLWLRLNHASEADTDPAQWSKARNVSAERLTQEIKQVGLYLMQGEIAQVDAEMLLDLLWAELGAKIP